jgi:glycosyltransferase involved in cell wall biosynthesis
MRHADAFLLPSLYEEWGYVAVESLLNGTPVVAYPVYPFQSMLARNLGMVAKERTPSALAVAIEEAITLDRGTRLAEKAAERFGSKVIAARLLDVWTHLLETPS